MHKTISAEDVIRLSHKHQGDFLWLDVRSEGEFYNSQLPQTVNLPILNNEHRHLVGLTYKHMGQDTAIELGHDLVGPKKQTLCSDWLKKIDSVPYPFLFCWRGGLRSKISQEWLHQAGTDLFRVEGGYKSIRQSLLQQLYDLPPLFVISGKTGTHKTKLLQRLPKNRVVDLEALAKHRGSSFGGHSNTEQPSQTTFENHLLWKFFGKSETLFLEDESRTIGRCGLPISLYEKMSESPRLVILANIEERVQNIFKEYIQHPLQSVDEAFLHERFLRATNGIKKRLGGALHKQIVEHINEAFTGDVLDAERHAPWIRPLLEQYYDKLYTYAFERKNCSVAFTGSIDECHQWLDSYIKSGNNG